MRYWLTILLLVASSAWAAIETHKFDTPEQEATYRVLINELRCLVCQNQNLADSNADLAKDLRGQIYQMIMKGKDKQQIIDYMVARYGDFVLYRPPFKATTALLWIGPFVILLAGVAILVGFIRRKGREQAPELSAADRERAEALLNQPKDQ